MEILDEIVSRAVGIHFLEDASSGGKGKRLLKRLSKGPRPMAYVEGHEDILWRDTCDVSSLQDLASLEPQDEVRPKPHKEAGT